MRVLEESVESAVLSESGTSVRNFPKFIPVLVFGGVVAGVAQFALHSAGWMPSDRASAAAPVAGAADCAYCQGKASGGVSSSAIDALLRANRAIKAGALSPSRTTPIAPTWPAGQNLSRIAGNAPPPATVIPMPFQGFQDPSMSTELRGAHILPSRSWFNDKNFSATDVDPAFNVNCKIYPTNPPDIRCTVGAGGGTVFQQMGIDPVLSSPTFQMLSMLAQGFAQAKTTSDLPDDSPPRVNLDGLLTHVRD
jgi:hypothetical protein